MRNFIFFCFSLFFSLANAQKPIEELIIGDWKQATSKQDSIQIHFDADRSMYIQNKDQCIGRGKLRSQNGDSVNLLLRYYVAPGENYHNIDFIYCLDSYYNTVARGEGIVEVLNPNLLRIAMNQDKPSPHRPQNFSNSIETLILERINTKNEADDCQKFHNGKFKITSVQAGITNITRENDIQIEENEDRSVKIKLKVNWIDQCTYTLEVIEYLNGEEWIPKMDEVIQTVKIIYTDENSYIQSSSLNNSDMVYTSEVEKID